MDQVGGDVAAPETRRRGRTLRLAVQITCLLLGFVLLPALYALVGLRADWAAGLRSEVGVHLLWNGAMNALVMMSCIRITGRFDRKLAAVFSRTLMAHGAMALIILITREYHSNQIMLAAMVVSAVGGLGVILVMDRVRQPRAAVLGSWRPLTSVPRIPFDRVTDPTADLRGYDLLLIPSVGELSQEWATALSRAMIMGQPVRHLVEYAEEEKGLVCIEHFDLEHLPPGGLTSYRTRKRLFDIVLVVASLPIALVLLGIGAAVVLITMGRPILFVQTRVGLGGKTFRMYKLRTMRRLAAIEGAATQNGGDARITPAGYWLRRFRIDELPQLWNVLKGDMSIIGPRPEWDVLSRDYLEQLPAYAYRHLVRPGITGWAQVRGGYASDLAETRTKVGYDLFYIKNLSFALDVQILARTIWTLLTGRGAR